MTSPDLPPYQDLTLYDVGPTELLNLGLAVAPERLPGAVFPPEGDVARVQLEALAVVGAELIYAINRLPSATVEGVLAVFGAVRSPGLPPTAQILFRLADTSGRRIPAGTQLRLDVGGEYGSLDLLTDADVTAAVGQPTVTAAATGAAGTSAANGTPAGTELRVQSPLTFVDGAELATPLTGGTDEEGDDAFRARAMQYIATFTTTLVDPERFRAAALSRPEISRAVSIDNHDPAQPGVTAGGHITIAALGPAGALLTSTQRTALQADLDAGAQADLGVHVVDPDITAINVTAEVMPKPGADASAVIAAVEVALEGYLSRLTWPWAAVVRHNELIALIDGVEGVDYVVDVTVPATDVALTGIAPLAELGTATIATA